MNIVLAAKILTKEEFHFRKKECDGLCSLCGEWAMGKADPNAENVYGVNVAKSINLIEVKNG